MILAIDIGNTGTTIALFSEDGALSFQSRLSTDAKMTDDRCAIDLMAVFHLYKADLSAVKGAILSSVVPPITSAYVRTLRRLTGRAPLVVGPGLKTGLNIKSEIHNQLGSDIVASAVAIAALYPTPAIVINSRTAVTFSYIGENTFEGCAIMPGMDIALEALSHYGALGAFSTGVGSTDMAAGMATGLAWFKVPSAIKVELTGRLGPHISGKDVILHLIGMIGVDGALYQSLEFVGDGVASLEMDDRFTICNMAIEAGAKNGIFPVDDRTVDYLKGRVSRAWRVFEADSDAKYTQEITIDLSALRPTVAFPHLPSNIKSVDEAAGKPIQQVVIGSCTNGRLKDLREAAAILKGRKVADWVRCIVIPATQQVYLDAMAEGLVADFINAGAVVSTPTCGPCLGGHMGVLSDGEWAISTTNRNFVGRMGPTSSMIILASPAVAAASAVTGVVTDPASI